jgi:hypothetical protein
VGYPRTVIVSRAGYRIGYLVHDPSRGIPLCSVIAWTFLSQAFKAGGETHSALESTYLCHCTRIVDAVPCGMDVETSVIVRTASRSF